MSATVDAPSCAEPYAKRRMELIDHSEKVRKEIQQRLVAGLNRGNSFMVENAQSAAPVRSGHLRDNTEIVQEANEANPVAIGASKAEYAAAVNRHNEPFWTQAWIRMKAELGGFFSG